MVNFTTMNKTVYAKSINRKLRSPRLKYQKNDNKTIPFCLNCLKPIKINDEYYRVNHKGKLFCKKCYEAMFI